MRQQQGPWQLRRREWWASPPLGRARCCWTCCLSLRPCLPVPASPGLPRPATAGRLIPAGAAVWLRAPPRWHCRVRVEADPWSLLERLSRRHAGLAGPQDAGSRWSGRSRCPRAGTPRRTARAGLVGWPAASCRPSGIWLAESLAGGTPPPGRRAGVALRPRLAELLIQPLQTGRLGPSPLRGSRHLAVRNELEVPG